MSERYDPKAYLRKRRGVALVAPVALLPQKAFQSPTLVNDSSPLKSPPEIERHFGATGQQGNKLGILGPQTEIKPPLEDLFAKFERSCPEFVNTKRWRQAVYDGKQFMAKWASKARQLGWTGDELFGTCVAPPNPPPLFDPLARYDTTGLIWFLTDREVVELTQNTASIKCPTGAIVVYRKQNKPALGPLGDSLDHFR